MAKRAAHPFNIYTELCPVSSATVIGAGLITITMGASGAGVFFIIAGIAVGVAGTLSTPHVQSKITKRRRA